MKKRSIHILLVQVLLVALAASGCRLNASVDVPDGPGITTATFYDDLAPYGEWVQVAPYGTCWAPFGVPAGWRPYTHGHWVYTQVGLTWVSDWDWGWAPFHYGRWWFDDSYGWVWIPGTVWGPAWCAWRYGDGWVGWAPLPPAVGWTAGVGLSFGAFDIERGYHPHWWCFAEQRELLSPRLTVVSVARNSTYLAETRNVTNMRIVHDRIVNESFRREQVEKFMGHPVREMRLADAASARALREGRARDGEVFMYRPHVSSRAIAGLRPSPLARREGVLPEARRMQQERERQQMEARHAEMQRELEQHQEAERRAIQRQNLQEEQRRLREGDLRRRQEEESHAFQRQRERENRTLQFWQQRERQNRRPSGFRERKYEFPRQTHGHERGRGRN